MFSLSSLRNFTLLTVIIIFLSSSCSVGGSSDSGGGSAETFDPNTPATQTKLYDENGFSVVRLENPVGGATLSGPSSDPDLSDITIKVYPGALNIGVPVDILTEKGQNIDTETVSSLLSSNIVNEAGDNVMFQPGGLVGLDKAVSISIPNGSAGLRLNESEGHLVILYRAFDIENKVFKLGVIATKDITKEDGNIKFAAPRFGSYQVSYMSNPVEESTEITLETANISNNSCLQTSDKDGSSTFYSLKQAPVSYALVKECGNFINSSNDGDFRLGGRCRTNGAKIKVWGAVEKEYTCQFYQWGEKLDLSELAEGEVKFSTTITLENGESKTSEYVFEKFTSVVEFDLAQSTYNAGAKEWNLGSFQEGINHEIYYFNIEKVSGPGEVSYAKVTQEDPPFSMFRFTVNSSVKGEHVVKVSLMDKYGNEGTGKKTLTLPGVETSVALKTPEKVTGNFTLDENGNADFYIEADNRHLEYDNILGYLVVRRADAAVTWNPTDGLSYNKGSVDSEHFVAGTIGQYGFNDNNLSPGRTYHYKVWEIAVGNKYSEDGGTAQFTVAATEASQIAFIGGVPNSIAQDGDSLVIGRGDRGFVLYDISSTNAAKPAPVYQGSLDGKVEHVAMVGSRLYVVEEPQYGIGADKLWVYDISDTSDVKKMGSYSSNQNDEITALYADGTDAYIGVNKFLEVIDASNMSSLSRTGTVDSGLFIDLKSIDKNGDYLCATNGGAVIVFDVSNKATPSVSGYKNIAGSTLGDVTFSKTTDDECFVTFRSLETGAGIADLSDKADPSFTTGFSPTHKPDGDGSSNPGHVFTTSTKVFFTVADDGFFITGTDMDATSYGSYDTQGSAGKLVVKGNYAYIIDGTGGVLTIDITDTASPALSDTKPSVDTPEEVNVFGSTVAFSDGWNGVKFFDTTTTDKPEFKSAYKVDDASANHSSDGYVYSAVISGTNAFLAASAGGLVKLDVSTLASPSFDSVQTALVSDVRDVVVAGSYIAIVDLNNGVIVFDPSDIGNAVGTFAGATGEKIFYNNDHLYVARGSSGIKIIDMSTPASLSEVVNANGSFDISSYTVRDIIKDGTDIYLATGEGYLVSIDGTDETQLTVLDFDGDGSHPLYSLDKDGDHIYAAASGGIRRFNVAKSSDIFLSLILKTEGQYTKAAAVVGSYIYASDYSSSIGSGMTIHEKP